MASDSEMNDASDQAGDGDVDSLVSTAESELEAEYVVNAIHAERKSYVEPDSEDDEGAFITQYLVEWAGYKIDRCSWEPKESFTSDDTLRDWEKKKKQIAAGKAERFDVKSWEKHVRSVQKETQTRKEERRRQRERRAQQKSNPQTKPTGLTNLDIVHAHGHKASFVAPKAPRRPSVDSTASSALFVPAETPPPPIKPAPRQPRQQMMSSRPISSVAQESSNKTPNPRLARPVKNPIARQKPPVRQKSPPQTARPALSSFGTGPGAKRAYRDRKERKWGEREPDMSQVQLMKPSDFSARTNMGTMGSAVGPSATIPDLPGAQNQPPSENPVKPTGLSNPPAGMTNARSDQRLEEPSNPASSLVMPPPAPRSLKSTSTASASSLVASVGPSAQLNPERRPIGLVNSASPSGPVDRSKAGAEFPSINPAGPSDLVSKPPQQVAQSRPISQAKLNGPSDSVVSDGSNSSRAVPTAPRAEVTSAKSAGPVGSNLTPLPLATPNMPRAMSNSNRLARLRQSQDSRERVRRHDTPDSARQPYNATKLDSYRPSEPPRRPSPSRRRPSPSRRSPPPRRSSPSHWSPPPRRPSPPRRLPVLFRRSSPSRRSPPPRRSSSPRRPSSPRRSSPSRCSPPPRRPPSPRRPSELSRQSPASRESSPSRQLLREMDDHGPPHSPSPDYSRPPSRYSSPVAGDSDSLANHQPPTTTESRPGASVPPGLSIQAQISRMPLRKLGLGCLKAGRYWWNQFLGEALIHVFVGPEKRPLGPFRLCGISPQVKNLLLRAKNSKTKQAEVWFKHMCTVREYERLCESSAENAVLSTGWVEGFSDTNENLYYLAEDLRKDDLIAIHYPLCERPNRTQCVLVAWSRGSQAFKIGPPSCDVPPGVPLLISARTMLAPIDVLKTIGSCQPSRRPQDLLLDTSLPLRTELPSGNDGLESSSRPRWSSLHDGRTREALQSRETPASAPAQSHPTASGLINNTNIPDPQPQNGFTLIDNFMSQIKIDVDKLATIEEAGKTSKARIFYLHFPLGDQEMQVLKAYLDNHGMIVLTSDSTADWEKFVENSKLSVGVAIFHESFTGYDTLQPPLNSVLNANSINFWVVRLHKPLELIDSRYCSPTDYHIRIFPYGGVILLTEDMLTDLKGVAITLQWFRTSSKRSSWTLMFPPRILEWIESRLDDEKYSQDHGLLLLIHTLIIKNSVTDPRAVLFDKASLDPNSSSSVFAAPLHDYGTRTEHQGLKIKNKIERDADHLIEFLAGWSLINIPRFRKFIALTSVKAPAGPRWDQWGHISVFRGGFSEFYRLFKVDSESFMAYLSGDPKTRPSTSQAPTPVSATTPRTPMTPNLASHDSNSSLQSTFLGTQIGQGKDKYPAPYK